MAGEYIPRLPEPPNAPLPRFGLRSAFVVMTVFAFLVPTIASSYRHYFRQLVVTQAANHLATPRTITDADLITLGEYIREGQYKSLNLSDSQLTDEGVELLAQFSSLEVIILDGTTFSGRGLMALRDLPKLQKISLLESKVSWDSAIQFSNASRCVTLELSRTRYGDAWRILSGYWRESSIRRPPQWD